MAEWTVYWRDNRSLARLGEIDDYQELELISRFNAVGTWHLRLHRDIAVAFELSPGDFGVEVVRRISATDPGTTIMSGPCNMANRRQSADANNGVITGYDDLIGLHSRLASPQPATAAPPYNSSADDVRTGVASTILRQYVDVNAGPSAIGPRKVTGLTLAADPLIGSSITGRARWVNLLELLQGLATAGGNLGFGVRQSGTTLPFTVYQPADKTATVRFSLELGNLVDFEYEVSRPECDYIFVGGGGEGTARTIKEVYDGGEQASWGRIEQFIDQRDTTADAELSQAATEHLAERGEKTSLSITPIDLPGQTFGTHYNLGDRVSIVIDGGIVSEIIREVRVKLTPDGPQTVVPVIGTPGKHDIMRLFQDIATIGRRLSNMERR